MSSLDRAINVCLQKMHSASGTDKGVYGEQAVFKICESLYQQNGGILYHSYSFKTDKDKAGNIKIGPQGNLMLETLSSTTEIDILYVTRYRVFPIEVKAYKAKEITLTDGRISGCFMTNKSPIHQNEMHARHLYTRIFRCLPGGCSDYILPVVVFVDECKLIDKRSGWQKSYIYKATLHNFEDVITTLNVPGEKVLDLINIDKCLTEALVKYSVRLPLKF